MLNKITERQIVLGCLVSPEYIADIRPMFNLDYLRAESSKRICRWAIEFYDKYNKVIGEDISDLFMEKIDKEHISDELAEQIEAVLQSISDEFEREVFNWEYIADKTEEYFQARALELHQEKVQLLLDNKDIEEANRLMETFVLPHRKNKDGVDLSDPGILDKLEKVFEDTTKPLFKLPGPVGQLVNEFLVRDSFITFQGPEKRGKCLPGSQLITMATGEQLSLEEVVRLKRTDIISFNEATQSFVKTKITDFYKNGKKPVYKVTTRSGRQVEVTKNHPFLTPIGWKDLTIVKQGSFIAVPKRIPIFGNKTLSDESIRLLAYFIADGCLVENNVRFTNGEKLIQDDFIRCVRAFKCDVRFDTSIDMDVINSKTNKGKHNKNYVRSFLKQYGLTGKGAKEKQIPDIIFQLSKKQIALFLNILFTCDGWICKNSTGIGFAVANESLARQVQMLMTKFGIVSKLLFKPNNCSGSWSVEIKGIEYVHLFIKEIGFSFRKQEFCKRALQVPLIRRSFIDKFPVEIARQFHDELKEEIGSKFTKAPSIREQLQKRQPLMRQSFSQSIGTKAGRKYMDSQIMWDEVTSIEYMGIKETYDLTVEEHHNFIANNVLVHNTWTLLEMAMKAVKQGCNVAFFQAGDMSENQQLRRIAIYRARLSDKEKYTGLQWVPEKDCFYQQIDKCTEPQREYDAGLFSREDGIKSREDITANILKEASLRDPDYRPCRNCPKYHGSVFLKQVDLGDPLTVSDAQREFKKFFIDKKRRFKLQTYPNQTLSVSMIESKLDQWEREDGFVPDVIVIDYMDLLVSNVKEFRHSQNDIWMKIRGLSQKRHTCVISATQADAKSYKTDTMTMDNFSEDKRKYGHVTAMIGLNQDQKGREKELGIMRWNIIVAREAEYIPSKCVSLIQSIKQGRALVSSYW